MLLKQYKTLKQFEENKTCKRILYNNTRIIDLILLYYIRFFLDW